MRITMDSLDGTIPKRGDLLQTNVGDKRERTCLILHVRKIKTHHRIPTRLPEKATHALIKARVEARRKLPPRFQVWAERWWELEPDFRMRLFRSAERRGGQRVIDLFRDHPKRRPRDPFFRLF